MRFVRWMVGLAVVTTAATATVWVLKPDETGHLRAQREALEQEKRELQRVVQRLTAEDRVAEVHVIDQIRAGQIVNGQPAASFMTTIEFIELDREGHPLPAKRFVIHDDTVYFDALVIKFDQQAVAEADELRGKNIALFRRIFGESQEPIDGFPIDSKGDVPNVYRIEPNPTPFEQKLWAQFWDYATNPKLAAEAGVRIAQGEAVYVPMKRGEIWTLTLQNNGGLNIKLRRPMPGSLIPPENGPIAKQ